MCVSMCVSMRGAMRVTALLILHECLEVRCLEELHVGEVELVDTDMTVFETACDVLRGSLVLHHLGKFDLGVSPLSEDLDAVHHLLVQVVVVLDLRHD